MFKPMDILRFVLSLLLVFVVIALQILFFTSQIVFNDKNYYSYTDNTEYFTLLREQVNAGLTGTANLTGVPANVLIDAVSDQSLKDYAVLGTKQFVDYLTGESDSYEATYDTAALKKAVDNYFATYLAKHNSAYDDFYKQQSDDIVKAATKVVESYVMVLEPDLVVSTGVAGKVSSIMKRVPMLEMLLVTAAALLVFGLWLTNKNHRMRTLWWTGSATLVASLMTLIPGIYLQVTKFASKIGLKDASVKWIAEHAVTDLIKAWCMISGFLLIAGGLLMIAYVLYRKRQISHVKRAVKRKTVKPEWGELSSEESLQDDSFDYMFDGLDAPVDENSTSEKTK